MPRRLYLMVTLALAVLVATAGQQLAAQQPAAQQPAVQQPAGQQAAEAGRNTPDPDRFEADIRKYEEADRTNPPAPGSIVFIGSSSIRRWQALGEDFPGLPVLNRGFGGSEYPDLVRYAERLVAPVKPKMVVFYAGDNDVSRGRTPEQIEADIRELAGKVHRALPQTRIVFMSIKPSLSRWKYVEQMRQANERMRKFVAEDPRRIYVDVFTPMLGADGQPRPELYVEDGLHLTRVGERLWASILAPVLNPKT